MSKTEIDNRVATNMDLLASDSSLGHAIDIRREFCREAAATLRRLDAENKALRSRLEIDPSHPIDGIAARDETIRQLEAQIKDLRTDANRYRWLRANAAEFEICVTDATGVFCGNRRDADLEIDACIVAGAAAKTGDAA